MNKKNFFKLKGGKTFTEYLQIIGGFLFTIAVLGGGGYLLITFILNI
jgi:hypothetical protein